MYTYTDPCLAHPLESWTHFDIVVNSAYALLTMPVTYKPTNVVIYPSIRYSGTSAYTSTLLSDVRTLPLTVDSTNWIITAWPSSDIQAYFYQLIKPLFFYPISMLFSMYVRCHLLSTQHFDNWIFTAWPSSDIQAYFYQLIKSLSQSEVSSRLERDFPQITNIFLLDLRPQGRDGRGALRMFSPSLELLSFQHKLLQ